MSDDSPMKPYWEALKVSGMEPQAVLEWSLWSHDLRQLALREDASAEAELHPDDHREPIQVQGQPLGIGIIGLTLMQT